MTEELLKEKYNKFTKATELTSENITDLLKECNIRIPYRRIRIPKNYTEFIALCQELNTVQDKLIDSLSCIFDKQSLNKNDITSILKHSSSFNEEQVFLLFDYLGMEEDEIDIEEFIKKICVKQEI
ncbi:hypothetical protein TUBRATIS_15280 [Tubulinosema ratisbonensis]|uniref:Uncharacterized protein n=1 Tax=Tubulinosema ratisbonensis TaxID=291195 RepID=A0A437ALA6_9MICR|nr:hypothetical protein TUBRATIS_15280 [Tubulinosema ratisbonensis]